MKQLLFRNNGTIVPPAPGQDSPTLQLNHPGEYLDYVEVQYARACECRTINQAKAMLYQGRRPTGLNIAGAAFRVWYYTTNINKPLATIQW